MRPILRLLLAGAVAVLLTPGAAQADSTSSTTTTTTTVSSTGSPPIVGTTTDVVTTTDSTMASSTTKVNSSDGEWLYTTTMTPTYLPDAYYFGHSSPWEREGYGSTLDLNRGSVELYLNGHFSRVDLEGKRVPLRMTADSYYDPFVLLSDNFERGMADPRVTQFSCDSLEISTGTTVTFWADTGHHSIMELDGPIVMVDEARIDTGRTWSHTFNTPGYYRFEDGFGGGPTGSASAGLIVHVTGPQMYTYLETSTCVSSVIETTTVTTQEKTNTDSSSAPQVQVEAARPKPQVVKPKHQIRNQDIK